MPRCYTCSRSIALHICGCANTNPHVVIGQHLHLTIAQDEAQCNNEMSQLVEAVQASLPSTSDQPGFELVYITRFFLH